MWPRAVVAAVVATILSGTLVGVPAAGQETRPVEQHRQRLEEAEQLARRGVDLPARERMGAVRALVGRDVVLLVGQRRIALGADPVLVRLEGTEPEDFRVAAAHVSTLRGELDALLASTTLDGDRLQRAVDRSYDDVDPSLEIEERVRRALGDLLARIVELLLRNRGATGTVASILLLLLGLGLVVWVARRSRVVPDPVEARREHEGEVDWRRRAEEALARGDLEAALRAEYRVLLHVLDARGVVDDAPSLTAAECRATVARTRPGLAGPVREATAAFERIAYGDQPVRREDVEAVQRAERAAVDA